MPDTTHRDPLGRSITLEGTVVGEAVWFHYDTTGDVLYLSQADDRETPAYSEATEHGLEVRRVDDEELIGFTIVNWRKNQGFPTPPEPLNLTTVERLELLIEQEARRLLAQINSEKAAQASTG